MSPYYFYSSGGGAHIFHVDNSGLLNIRGVTYGHGVRPVINLKADVTITGSGTTTDPYVVS